MKLWGNWNLSWSRNVAIGVLWTRQGEVGIVFLGITISRNLPTVITRTKLEKQVEWLKVQLAAERVRIQKEMSEYIISQGRHLSPSWRAHLLKVGYLKENEIGYVVPDEDALVKSDPPMP